MRASKGRCQGSTPEYAIITTLKKYEIRVSYDAGAVTQLHRFLFSRAFRSNIDTTIRASGRALQGAPQLKQGMRRSKAARGFVSPRTTGERAQWTVFSSTPRESAHQTQESWSGNKLRHPAGAPVCHADNPRPLFSAPNHASMNSRLNPPVCCMCRRVGDRLWVRGSWNDALWAAIAPWESC